jgi:hypothetical protein
MTRIFTDGAEMKDILFWDGYYEVGIGTDNPFESPNYYTIPGGGNRYAYHNFVALSEAYFRARVRNISFSDGAGLYLFQLRKGTTTVASILIDDMHHFTAYVSVIGIVGTSFGTFMNAGQWYELEVYFKEANAPNGRFVIRVDANTIIDYTGDTQPGADTVFDNIRFQAENGSWLNIDDLAMNDTAGGVDNSWCGDGIVMKVTPNDNSATTNNWHGSDSDDTDNYLLVDEYPYDGDTTYNYRDGADAGVQQQYKMSDDYAGTNKTITRIYAEGRVRKTSAVADTIKIGILAAGGSDVMSAELELLAEGAYLRIVGPDELVNPVDSNPWEEADIDALEFVAEIG